MTLTVDVPEAAARLEDATADDVLAWARATVPRLAVTSSFGADSAALLSVVARVDPTIPVLFIDTGLHFAETLAYRRALVERLGLRDVRDLRPVLGVGAQARQEGGGLYLRDPDRCCLLRKIAPLDAALADFDGWATGVRREQTLDRAGTPVVSLARRGDRDLVKVAPLARWTAADVERHLKREGLPRHPLADAGYPSIGCAPCTSAVRGDGAPREGRWLGSAKTECGIHLEYPEQP